MGSCASKKKKNEENIKANETTNKVPEHNPETSNVNSKELAYFPNFYYFERSKAILYKISKDSLINYQIKVGFPIPQDSAMAYLSSQVILLVGGVTNNQLSDLVLSLSIDDKKINKHCGLSVASKFGQLHEHNNWIYYVGSFYYGDDGLEQGPLMRYCIRTDKWENLKIQGVEQGFSKIFNMGTCVLGNKLLLVGGQVADGKGEYKNSKKVYSVNLNDGFGMKCEGKLPVKIIRSNIAAGNRHAIVSGGVYLKTKRPNRFSFVISWNGIDYSIERMHNVGIDLTERYPATYDNNTALFISFPNIAVISKKHQGWYCFKISDKEKREVLKSENPLQELQDDSSSDQSLKAPKKSPKAQLESNDQRNLLSMFVKKNNTETNLEEENIKNSPEVNQNLSFSSANKGSSESLDSISSKSSNKPAMLKLNPKDLHDKNPDGPKADRPKRKNNKNTSDEDSSEKKKSGVLKDQPKIQAPILPSNAHNKKDSFEILQRLQSGSGKIGDSKLSKSSSSSWSSSDDSSSSKSLESKKKNLKISGNGAEYEHVGKTGNGSNAGNSNLEPVLPPNILPVIFPVAKSGENKESSSDSSDSEISMTSSENEKLDLFSKIPNNLPLLKNEEVVNPKESQYANAPNIAKSNIEVALPPDSIKPPQPFNLIGRNPLAFLQDPQIPMPHNNGNNSPTSSSSDSSSSSSSSKNSSNVPVLEIEAAVHPKNKQFADEFEEFQVITTIDLNLQNIENDEKILNPQNQGVRVLTPKNERPKKSGHESQGVRVLAPENNIKPNIPEIPRLNLRPKTSEPHKQIHTQRPKTSENFNNSKRTLSLRLINPYITSRNFKSESTLLITASDHLSLAKTHRESTNLASDFGEFYEKSLSSRPVLDIFSSPKPKKVRFSQTSPKIKIKCKIFFNQENLQKLLDIMSNELKIARIRCPHITTRGSFYQLIQSYIQSSPITFSNLTRIVHGMPLIFSKSDFKPTEIWFIIDRSQIDHEHLSRYQFTVAIYKAYKVALLKQN